MVLARLKAAVGTTKHVAVENIAPRVRVALLAQTIPNATPTTNAPLDIALGVAARTIIAKMCMGALLDRLGTKFVTLNATTPCALMMPVIAKLMYHFPVNMASRPTSQSMSTTMLFPMLLNMP